MDAVSESEGTRMSSRTASNPRLAALAVAAAIGGPAALAYAHESTEPTINGPSSLATTQVGDGDFYLAGVTLDCPPPEGAPFCHITVKAKSRKPLRLRRGGSLKIRTIGSIRYDLESNRDLADVKLVTLSSAGETVLKRYGKVKILTHVTNVQSAGHQAAPRDFKQTLTAK
jgi:hypothetical protein